MIIFLVILWFGLGLLGSKFILDRIWKNFHNFEPLDIIVAIWLIFFGPMCFMFGLIFYSEEKMEFITNLVKNYYKRRER